MTTRLEVRRCGPHLALDRNRVLLRRMYPGSHEFAIGVVNRVLALDEATAEEELGKVLDLFSDRHYLVHETFYQRFREVQGNCKQSWCVSDARGALIGSMFMQEYSIESAALFNPSIVPHPDQTDLAPGCIRFVLSLRATGEGHVSSVTFRTGVINASCRVMIDPLPPQIVESWRDQNTSFCKRQFVRKVNETHGNMFSESFTHKLLEKLPDEFTLDVLRAACSEAHREQPGLVADTVCTNLLVLAESEYEVTFPHESLISQRILFPSAPSQSHGIEDARFVHFTHEDGSKIYYATYTAYDGRIALPQIMETSDFSRVKFTNLSGAIQNKGFALFPRKIDGKYWMLSRQDDVNVLIMSSDVLHHFDSPSVLLRPEYAWEAFKIGNCGSPVETPFGWLVLTHGVGAVRRYAIGAALLDLNDPSKVIGRLPHPLIEPNEVEREGYVPNVCYTCGVLLHGEDLIIPYAMSDSFSSFATVKLELILRSMGVSIPATPTVQK